MIMALAQVRVRPLHTVLLASIAVLTACSPKQAQTGQAAIPGAAAITGVSNSQLSASNATVFGRIIDTDWYMIVAGAAGVKPLVIWSPSKPECDSTAAEFNLKSVDPNRSDEPPKAWCTTGYELRTKHNIQGA